MDEKQGSVVPASVTPGGDASVHAYAKAHPLLRLGIILLMVGLMSFALYQCYRHLTVGLNTLRTQEVTDVSYLDLDLYVFRDEAAVSGTGGNIFLYHVQDGEKVGVGSTLWDAYVSLDDEAVSSLQQMLDLYGARLARLEGSRGQGMITVTDPASAKDRIDSDYLRILSAVSEGNLKDMSSLSEDMMMAIERYRILSGGGGSSADQAGELRKARDELLQGLNLAGSCTTDRAGWFYYDTDGFESVFRYDDVMTLTPADFRVLTQTVNETRESALSTGGKMVYHDTWYAVAAMPLAEAAGFVVGDSYTMLCDGGAEVPMTCVRVDADQDGAMLVFKSQYMPEDFHFDRRFHAQVAYGQVSGYRVPLSALVTETSPTTGETVAGVYVLEGNYVVFRRVWARETREGYVIAYTEASARSILEAMDARRQEEVKSDGWSFLTLNDNMITDGSGLYDGKIVG